MTSTLTRRGLVAAAPAVVVAASGVPAFAISANTDSELLALQELLQKTRADLAIYGPLHTKAEEALADARRAGPGGSREEVAVAAGLDLAEAAWNAAVDANTKILDRIAATPARTLEGLLFKAKACAKADYYPDLEDAIIDDLVAMAGGANA